MGAEAFRRRAALGALFGASILLFSADAPAYCRTSTCGELGTGADCVPDDPFDCGIPLKWPTDCVSYTLQEGASNQVSLETAEAIFATAFEAWTTAACPGGGNPRIQIQYKGTVSCTNQEYNQLDEEGNSNIIIFRDDEWLHDGADSTLALTTVTYNTMNGEIYDVDMEINSAGNTITTGDNMIKFDLLSIATHEVGHFLGLSHSNDAEATMNPAYMTGSTTLRDLADDDRAGICATYPPGAPIPSTCDATPRHGFSELCAADLRSEGCCSVAPGSPGGSGREAVLAALAAAAI
ncbi:MAG: matrixin family metalloprotease, partial [Polyangiaceae bacterium]|nr:matrixin family metalloprotease [Polyangiaceae bacterium]